MEKAISTNKPDTLREIRSREDREKIEIFCSVLNSAIYIGTILGDWDDLFVRKIQSNNKKNNNNDNK